MSKQKIKAGFIKEHIVEKHTQFSLEAVTCLYIVVQTD